MRLFLYRLFCSVVTIAGVWGVGRGMDAIGNALDAHHSLSGLAIFGGISVVALGVIIGLGWIADVRAGRAPGRGRTRR